MRTLEYHDTTVRVRYAETDQMGVVYHANYLIWFEVGRVELMRAMGFEYKAMETEDDCQHATTKSCASAPALPNGAIAS